MKKLLLPLLLSALPASAREAVHVIRTEDDTRFPADASFCGEALPGANVLLGAAAYAPRFRVQDGAQVNAGAQPVGRATACLKRTVEGFTPGVVQEVALQVSLGKEGPRYRAKGTCTWLSTTVPVQGLMLVSCGLILTEGPPGLLGGAVTSLSVFNPQRLPGFITGSHWTLHAYFDK
jgi:hypothetical protein